MNNIAEKIMFIRLSFGLPRQSRKVQATADNVSDQKRVRASAKLYSGKAFGAIKSLDADTRFELSRLAIDIPACFRGTYILPVAILDKVNSLLQTRMESRRSLVQAFAGGEYPMELIAAREALGDAFRESDFPPVDRIQDYFRMSWSIFRLSVPADLPEATLQAEREKFNIQMQDVFAQCRVALRESMADLVGHLAERLQPDAEGNRKRLCATTVDQLKDFLDTLNSRDITSDDAIRAIGDKARALLSGCSADYLRDNRLAAGRIGAGMAAIKAEIDQAIERDGGRKIDLDMD